MNKSKIPILYKKQIIKKFNRYEMDENWQSLGKISSENLKTFLAISKAKIKLYNSERKNIYEYVFKKNSQISIKNNHLIFQNKGVKKLLIETVLD